MSKKSSNFALTIVRIKKRAAQKRLIKLLIVLGERTIQNPPVNLLSSLVVYPNVLSYL